MSGILSKDGGGANGGTDRAESNGGGGGGVDRSLEAVCVIDGIERHVTDVTMNVQFMVYPTRFNPQPCKTRSGPNIPAVDYWRGVILWDLTGDIWPQNGLLVAFLLLFSSW